MHVDKMLVPTMLLNAFIGLICTMAFAGDWCQPDWSLALLLAVLLSKSQTWIWVLPSIGMHDLFLYWSIWGIFPFTAFAALFIFYTDKKIGPGQPQRWAVLVLHVYAMWLVGLDTLSLFLTITLSIWLWFIFSSSKEKAYVEPA
ncbi:MAG: hypothetical protein Q9N02_03535 [Ghiorsea sp.]|nr:hypothetical protein [Ghiorsea sp.]